MGSKYIDTTAIMQVIGCVFNTPQLLEITDKYSISEATWDSEINIAIKYILWYN